MANGLETLIARTRHLAGISKARELNDRQLLEQFAGGDESAFTMLVDRYGGLVLGVCQRILHHTQDTEDAFQATFLVLARKANRVAWKDSVANWLHGVACRISFQIRRDKARRQARERTADEPMAETPDLSWSELKPVLDEELDRLPSRYRIPLILCCLEGKSRDEAAAQLGWSVGSVKGRLERAREILRSRLARRGLVLSAALAALLMTGAGAKAAVPITLGLETVRAGMALLAGKTAGVVSIQVLTLSQGVIHAMFMTKLKYAAAVVLTVASLGLGTGYVAHQALAAERNPQEPRAFLESLVGERERPPQKPSISGLVKATDTTKNTITILVARDEPEGKTFDVVKDVKVVIREGRETKDAKFADVQPRTRVTLILDDAKKVVQSIEVAVARKPDGEPGGRDPALVFGMLTEVDETKRTVTLQTGGRGEDPKSTTYDLAKDAKVIFRQGRIVREGKLANLELKKPVQLRLDDAKKLVIAIEVAISTRAQGAVGDIDQTKNTITLEIGGGRGMDPKTETYELSKDVKVFYRVPTTKPGRGEGETVPLKLADLAAKASVSLQLDDERKIVESIDVALITMAGAIQSVDADKFTLLLRPLRGDDMDLKIAKDARIIVKGEPGKLDAIGVGADAHVTLSPDRTQVLILQSPPPEGRR